MTSNTKEVKDVLLEVSDSVHLCRVCYEEFNDKSKVSRILSCGHSFCTECLLSVVRASNSSYPICPECRKLTKQTVLSLPVNFHFMQMVRKMGLSVDSPEEEVSSTAATIGREEQALGELDMHNRLDDMTMPELITQFRSILGCMKEKTSRGMYQQYSFGEPNYPLSLCMDKLSEIDDAVDIIENSLAMALDDEDGDTHFGEDEDDEEQEDMYDTDGTSSEHYRRIVGDFENLNVVAAPFDIVFNSELPSEWDQSVDNDSRYTEDVFVPDANRSGTTVWRCSICECQVPQGSEESHLNGRRHNLNSDRQRHNFPIISGDEWQTMNNRMRMNRNRFRQESNDFNYNNVPIPPPHIPRSFFPPSNSESW